MKYKGKLDCLGFLRVINKNGYTNFCCNCYVPNGECVEIAKEGRCFCYNNNEKLRNLLRNKERERV